ncbi:MAG: ribosome maturation factor RimP [Cytophagaceae bacterium]
MANQEIEINTIISGLLQDKQEFFLVDFTLSGPVNRKKVTVFLDKDSGISIDECGEFSLALGEAIEGANVFSGAYTLEVSSPGMDSPMKVLRQYLRRIGQKVQLVTTTGAEIKGVLQKATEAEITLTPIPDTKKNKKNNQQENEAAVETIIPYSEIKKCNLIVSFK